MKRTMLGWLIVAALGLAAMGSRPALAADRPLQDFFGAYAGQTISESADGLSPRDLNVTIKPWKRNGFTLEWTTVIHAKDGDRPQSYSINFQPSSRPGIYGSAMRNDMFGGEVPLDPLKGEPYVWARINGDTLTVYSLLITDEGGYEIQTFDRTLTPDGMRLTFSRIRDGETLRQVTGTLKRVKG